MNKISIHMTNINGVGVGATRLLDSLLPELVSSAIAEIDIIYADKYYYKFFKNTRGLNIIFYKRYVSNAISRFLECIVFGRMFDGGSPLLVLGDIPLRTKSKQVVFVQNPHLVRSINNITSGEIKFLVMRILFKYNLRYASGFIVQTDVMRRSLSELYNISLDSICVIPQPVPSWLMGRKTVNRYKVNYKRLKLFYPSKIYAHKGHQILHKINWDNKELPVESLILTVDRLGGEFELLGPIKCVGLVDEITMVELYHKSDALLFLSEYESYGFPLIEAMYMGMAIICPSEPYAETLCGDQAIYFDLGSEKSLCSAINKLSVKISSGWAPDWSTQLANIPDSWSDVSDMMINFTQKRML